jgi:uncharacterized protein YjbI with pentapeptide repeats
MDFKEKIRLHQEWLEDPNKGAKLEIWDLDLQNSDLSGSRLPMSAMYNCKFSKVNANGAVLYGADFEGSDFFCGSFQKANLCYAKFNGTNCVNADFRGANLEGTVFTGANLRGVDLRGSNLKDTRFEGAILEGAQVDDDAPLEVLLQIPGALGRRIILNQLRELVNHRFILDWIAPEDQEYPREELQAFEVPEELTSAFVAYDHEYLSLKYYYETTCTLGDVFYNGDDQHQGVKNKIIVFYAPFIDLLESLYPDVKLRICVETSTEDDSVVMFVTQNQRINFVPYLGYWKVWESLFNQTDPMTVYRHLEAVFREMESQLRKGLRLVS